VCAPDQSSEEQSNQKPTHQKNPAAVALGKLGGKKGGPAKRDKLSPERRKETAQKAARDRWAKRPLHNRFQLIIVIELCLFNW
jgi:hypothetical protein